MAQEFLLPDPGEGIHEADILEIHISAGDGVKDGDPLFSVETDKAVVDIPASFDGQIDEIRVEVGDVVEVGSVLLTYSEAGDTTTSDDEIGSEQKDEETATAGDGGGDATPAEEQEERAEEAGGLEERPGAEPDGRRPRKPPVPASPATRSLAKRLDVDLHAIEGSGPDGRIEPGDVKAAADGEEAESTRESETERGVEPEAEGAAHGEAAGVAEAETDEEWIDLRGVRKASARQMARSWREIPHVTHHDVADITDLEDLRREHAAGIEEEGGKLSVTAFLVKAAAVALSEHPRFNASIDMENERIALKQQVNIGVAVDTEDGLVVPVISDVTHRSIFEVAMELPELANRMRSGDRSIEDMRGGTFTITNPGGIGGTSFEPIINHPEVAILGAARAQRTPVLNDDEDGVMARLHLPLVLAFDHRVNDGADAARLMNTITGLLEDPSELLLRV